MSEYSGEDRRRSAGWHVDKTFSISHIVTTVTIIVTGTWYLAGQDQRINANTMSITHVAKTSLDRDLMIERNAKDNEQRSTRAVERIESKIDKIYEYLRGKN